MRVLAPYVPAATCGFKPIENYFFNIRIPEVAIRLIPTIPDTIGQNPNFSVPTNATSKADAIAISNPSANMILLTIRCITSHDIDVKK